MDEQQLTEGPDEGIDVDQDTEPLTDVDSDEEYIDVDQDTEPFTDEDPDEEDPDEEDPDEEDPDEEDPDEEDPAEEVPSEAEADLPYDADDETHAEESDDDDDGYMDIHMYPLPTVRDPSPPPPPLSPFDDEFEELTPEAQETEDAPPADPATPPPAPTDGVPLHVHLAIVAGLSVELSMAEARLGEARRELDAERAARFASQTERRTAIPRAARRELTSIELRARTRIRALRGDRDGRISRTEVEEIFRHAMLRVRDLTRD